MKRLFTYFAVMFAASALMVSCSDSKEKEENTDSSAAAVEQVAEETKAPGLKGLLTAHSSRVLGQANCVEVSGYESAISDKAMAVIRTNFGQLLSKSGKKGELMQALRAQMELMQVPSSLAGVATDLRNTGIDIDAPVYVFVQELGGGVVYTGIVGKVYDKAKLDALVEFLGMEPEQKQGCTIIPDDFNEGQAYAYNNVAFMLGSIESLLGEYEAASQYKVKDFIVSSLNATTSSESVYRALPEYKHGDLALVINGDALVDYYKLTELLMSCEDESYLEVLKALDVMCGSTVHGALTFANGYVEMEAKVDNLQGDYSKMLLPCSNENLKYVSADAVLVANGAVNGEQYFKYIENTLNGQPEVKKLLNEALKSAFDEFWSLDLVMGMAEPLVGSINGDMLMAINHFSESKQEACTVVSVKDNSIFNFVDVLCSTTPELKKLDENTYSAKIEDINAYFGQKDNLIYASTPGQLELKANPATKASWYSEVAGSYGYIVANLSSLLKDPTVKLYASTLVEELGVSSADASKIINSLDYLLYEHSTKESCRVRLSFKNKSKNALAQIIDLIPMSESYY